VKKLLMEEMVASGKFDARVLLLIDEIRKNFLSMGPNFSDYFKEPIPLTIQDERWVVNNIILPYLFLIKQFHFRQMRIELHDVEEESCTSSDSYEVIPGVI
jgi:hypothetical protein